MSLPSAMALSSVVEIYPREGTETSTRRAVHRLQKLKFIPVRGRKLFKLRVQFQSPPVEIYPREGAETLFTHL